MTKTTRHLCAFCGSWTLDETTPGMPWCRVCVTLVTCEQCCGARRARPEVGLCDLCRRRNAIDVRQLFGAAATLAWLDLEHLARAPVVFPHRAPLTGLETAALARAARPLHAAVLALPIAPLLRDEPRKGPQRATRAPEVKDETVVAVPVPGRVRRR